MANLVYEKQVLNNMQSTEGLAALFNHATEGIMVTNDRGEITTIRLFNQADFSKTNLSLFSREKFKSFCC